MAHKDPAARKAYNAEYHARNREHIAGVSKAYRRNPEVRARLRVARLARPKTPAENRMFHGAKQRARDKGLPFDIELSDVRIPALCPALGIPLKQSVGGLGPASPTLDRFVPSKGYVRGNVHVISSKANSIKHNATPEEVEQVARWMRSVSSR